MARAHRCFAYPLAGRAEAGRLIGRGRGARRRCRRAAELVVLKLLFTGLRYICRALQRPASASEV